MNSEYEPLFYRPVYGYENVNLNTLMTGGFRMAIPPRGELTQGSIDYLSSLGWNTILLQPEARRVWVDITSTVTVFRKRADDAVRGLRDGSLDIAILGADIITESRLDPQYSDSLVPLNKLTFGGCRFCMAFPLDQPTPSEREVFQKLDEGGKIATSLPNILTALFKQRGYVLSKDQLITPTGGVESALKQYNDVFAVADRVSSGDTMYLNYLRPDWILWESSGAYVVATQEFFQNRIYQPPESQWLSF